jgi:NMD protein affecting ribosome stability and mRNA decay
MTTLIYTQKLTTNTCPNCGVLHAYPVDVDNEAQSDHSRSIYCPNGHKWHYIGTTEAQRLKDSLKWAREREQATRDLLTHTEHQLRGQKAAKTRILNRIHAGVCPHCNRTFQDLARHMTSKHAEVEA